MLQVCSKFIRQLERWGALGAYPVCPSRRATQGTQTQPRKRPSVREARGMSNAPFANFFSRKFGSRLSAFNGYNCSHRKRTFIWIYREVEFKGRSTSVPGFQLKSPTENTESEHNHRALSFVYITVRKQMGTQEFAAVCLPESSYWPHPWT